MIDICKALADPARLKILEFLHRPDAQCCTFADRVCACDVESLLGLSQPATSHHMRILVRAGLVTSEKHGRFIYYRLNAAAFASAAEYFARVVPPPRRPARAA
ncbi:MAG: winged helix-turn-helix transcriptional regulator [Rhodospirillales bacterium]|nr:winged helix-turn-helix transcriptional regulator [Rhodospirillales bacterium]